MVKKNKMPGMDDVWGDVCKSFGADGLFDDEKEIMNVEVVSSGSASLDEAVGPWGLPLGRVVQFAGRESSGKTLLSLLTISEWQKLHPKNWALFIDAEYTFDPRWAEKLGVDLSRLKRRKMNKGVQIFEFLCGVPHKEFGKKKIKPGLLDWVIAHGGAKETGLGVIVLDSIAAVQPPIEEASTSGKHNIAPMGRFLAPELRKLTPLLSDAGVMMIAINQVRINPMAMFGDPESSPGGSAWKHHCSVMVHLAKILSKDSAIKDENDVQVGHRIRVRIDKNKVAPPFRKCEFDIKYTEGIVNSHVEIADLAIKYGVVTRPSNITYMYRGKKITNRGRDKFLESVLTGAFESGDASYNSGAEFQQVLLEDVRLARDEGVKPDDSLDKEKS